MRTFILLLLGGICGAALFHAYYLHLDRESRCAWDNPLDQPARTRCQATDTVEKPHGYAPKARRQLDDLIGDVAK
jgi:hypothetical protein